MSIGCPGLRLTNFPIRQHFGVCFDVMILEALFGGGQKLLMHNSNCIVHVSYLEGLRWRTDDYRGKESDVHFQALFYQVESLVLARPFQ